MLHGMTAMSVNSLVPLARSWVNAAKLTLNGTGYDNAGFNQAERAYQIVKTENRELEKLELQLSADEEHPIINPAFVIENWGERDVVLTLDSDEIKRGKTFRFGHRHTLEGTDLILWIETESIKPMTIVMSPDE